MLKAEVADFFCRNDINQLCKKETTHSHRQSGRFTSLVLSGPIFLHEFFIYQVLCIPRIILEYSSRRYAYILWKSCHYVHTRTPQFTTVNHVPTHEDNRIFTARNEVGARLCFHRRVWFCSQGGGSASVHAGIPPPPPHPHHRRACWEIRSTRGRYASYWNAILLNICLLYEQDNHIFLNMSKTLS